MTARALLRIALPLLLSAASTALASDPVVEFIVEADSLAKLDDASAFEQTVAERGILVGAAVGQLLDIAFQLAPDDPAAAQENVDFARRLAAAHDSPVPAALIDTYDGWSEAQRATKHEAQALEARAGEARRAGDAATDVELLERAAGLYASIGDDRARAVNLGTQGVAHWYRGDWDAVEAAYGSALEARRAIEDRILEGRTLNGLGSAHFQQSTFADALVWYRRAIDLREQTGDRVGLATSLTYAANCETAMGRPIEARELLERAVPVLEASGNDRRRLEALHSVGVLHRNMRRAGEAIESFEAALALVEAAPEFEAGIRLDLAGALSQQGRYREAIDEIARAESLAGDAPDPQVRFRLHSERGQAALNLEDLDRADEELRAARELARSIGAPELLALAESNLAFCQSIRGDHETALATARGALEQARTADALLYEIFATQVAAGALERLGRHEDVLELVDSTIARHDELAPELLTELKGLQGNALTQLGRYGAARAELRTVRRLLIENGRLEYEWVPLMGMGDSFETLAPDSALAYYDAAFEALERHRAASGSGAIRTSYLSEQRGGLYEGVVDYFARVSERRDPQTWSRAAFAIAERARARGLLDLVTRSVATEDDARTKELLDALYRIEDSGPEAADERRRLQDALARHFDARMADAVPWMQRGGEPATPATVSAALDGDTAAIVYAVGEEATWIWAIDDGGHVLRPTAGRADLQERVVALREALQTPGFGDAALAAESHALYRALIEPVVDRLDGHERLWIVPDGVLFEIPFELLLRDDAGARPDWRRAEFLARDHVIGYAPSATLLLQLRARGAAGAASTVVAVGDPDFGTLDLRAGTQELELPPLPESRREIDALRDLRGDDATTLIGADASESALRRALERHRPSIVHLATHGLVDREEPALTCVAFARDPEGTDDGYLYTLEVLALPLETELVVLSACDTGRGKLERGEGTIGLTRSFLASGARRVVASLWPVADASTSTLMRRFYRELLDRGRTVEDSLNRARAELWSDEQTAHPYYWAPFVLMGSDAPMPAATRG